MDAVMRIPFAAVATAALCWTATARAQWHGDNEFRFSRGASLLIAVWKGEREPKALMKETVRLDGSGHTKLANGKRIKVGFGNMQTALATIEEGYRTGDDVIGLGVTAQILARDDKPIITLLGEVKKPGHGAFKEGMTLADLIATAGGFTEGAYTKRVNVIRMGFSTLVDCRNLDNAKKTKMEKGDLVRVDLAPLKF